MRWRAYQKVETRKETNAGTTKRTGDCNHAPFNKKIRTGSKKGAGAASSKIRKALAVPKRRSRGVHRTHVLPERKKMTAWGSH